MSTPLTLSPHAYLELIDTLITCHHQPVVLEDPGLFRQAIEGRADLAVYIGNHPLDDEIYRHDTKTARLETGEEISLPPLKPIGWFRGAWLFDASMVRAFAEPPGYVLTRRAETPARFDLSGPGGELIKLEDVDTLADARLAAWSHWRRSRAVHVSGSVLGGGAQLAEDIAAATWAHRDGKRSAGKPSTAPDARELTPEEELARELTPDAYLALITARLEKHGGMYIGASMMLVRHPTGAASDKVFVIDEGAYEVRQLETAKVEALWARVDRLINEGA